MSKAKKNEFIPEIRFPEFKDIGGWDYLNGNELFEPISNKDHNSDLPILAITQEHGAIPRDLINYHVSVTDKSVESYKVVEVGDFVISLRSFQGGIEYSTYKGLCSPAYIILRKKVDVENDFYRHYFKSIPFIKDLNKNLEGIRDGKMVSYKQFSEILLPKPISDEQHRIASCLSSLDELLDSENQKLDALKTHKSGLLEQLFPQEGELIPKLRFDEFKDSGEWKESLVSELGEPISGLTYSPDDVRKEGLLVLRSSNIKDNQINLEDCVYVREDISGAKICEPDDILMCVRNGSKSLIGKNALIPDGIPFSTHGAFMTVFRAQNPKFVFQLFQSDLFKLQVAAGLGATINSINTSLLMKYQFLVPSEAEQQKIASFLATVDDLVARQVEKIRSIKEHKLALLQGLFPNPTKSIL